MVKCFVTGDNHFGMRYEGKLAPIREKLIEVRYEALQRMVDHANEEGCDLFIITGDLFEKNNTDYIGGGNAKKGEEAIQRVIDILKGFHKTVLVLPGNHDYMDDSSTLWKAFGRRSVNDDRILLLSEFKKKPLGRINGTEVVVYPAFCQRYQSESNNLAWIKKEDIQTENTVNIGLAHGTIEGLSCDNEGVYFKMTRSELEAIPVDVWFIGHAHVPYPKEIPEDGYAQNVKIFNAGTHQQTDIGNRSEGYGFIVEIEKSGSRASIRAKKWKSGIISFHEITVNSLADREDALRLALEKKLNEIRATHQPSETVIRVSFQGSAKAVEYTQRESIYQDLTKDFLFSYLPDWYDFYEEISPEKIKAEFHEKSLLGQFLNSFLDDAQNDPEENRIQLNMVYSLIRKMQ